MNGVFGIFEDIWWFLVFIVVEMRVVYVEDIDNVIDLM